jgi:DTW domain-containing protein YfiP
MSDPLCTQCLKPVPLCLCAELRPIENRIELLILQHPQEQDRELGTARLLALQLRHATLRVGLSCPSLARALGRPADPKRWAVLYLGAENEEVPAGEIVVVDSRGAPLPLARSDAIDGIVVLDGSWSQAKTLWWRNPWVLKCRRLVLRPLQPSLYAELRREPRPAALSTLEAAAFALARLEARPEIETALGASFAALIARYRAGRRTRPPRSRRRH